MKKQPFLEKSWCRFPYDPALHDWVNYALPVAIETRLQPGNRRWMRCGDTWFVGVNVLPNDSSGALGNGPPLRGEAVEFLRHVLGVAPLEWEPAQVSICYPGYPQPMDGESGAAFRFRRDKFAAHIDGILPIGERRRRFLREHHRFIFGIPLGEHDAGAAPFVVWEGSHEIVRDVLAAYYGERPARSWRDIDITELYRDLRKRIFAECERIKIAAKPGEAYIVHRLALHGIAPWQPGASADPGGRIICYFRPETTSPKEWLNNP
ncbi:MAG: hypothetical protein KJO31_13470 [Gammaproteobacteria bacterium]|nr:hypothetical protein [Gammaproteobacteria bacterium]